MGFPIPFKNQNFDWPQSKFWLATWRNEMKDVLRDGYSQICRPGWNLTFSSSCVCKKEEIRKQWGSSVALARFLVPLHQEEEDAGK